MAQLFRIHEADKHMDRITTFRVSLSPFGTMIYNDHGALSMYNILKLSVLKTKFHWGLNYLLGKNLNEMHAVALNAMSSSE